MEKFFEKLSLAQYFRYFLSGIVAILTLSICFTEEVQNLFLLCNTFKNTIITPIFMIFIVIIIGLIIYSFHEGIIYKCIRKKLHKEVFPNLLYEELDEQKYYVKINFPQIYTRLNLHEWFARIHFSYCVCWAILISLFIGNIMLLCVSLVKLVVNWSPYQIVFFIIAVLNFCSARNEDKEAMKKEKMIIYNIHKYDLSRLL